MGVEYEHYLVPDNPTFKPDAEQISRLVNAPHVGRYVIGSDAGDSLGKAFPRHSSKYDAAIEAGCVVERGPGEFARFPCPCSTSDVTALADRDFRLIWTVNDLAETRLKYPLSKIPDEQAYWDLELHVPARDYVYHLSSIIEPFNCRAACRCGQVLEFDEESVGFDVPVFADLRIYVSCPRCGAPFRPQDYSIRLKWGRTGEDLGPRAGGAVYLFAIVIDCGKCYDRDEPPRASDEFLRTCEEAIGARLFQIGDFNGC